MMTDNNDNTTTEKEPSLVSWSLVKTDFWKKPSKWQICMPRLRLIAKCLVAFIFMVVVLKILNDKPGPPPKPKDAPPTEDEAREAEKRTNWLWKDFKT